VLPLAYPRVLILDDDPGLPATHGGKLILEGVEEIHGASKRSRGMRFSRRFRAKPQSRRAPRRTSSATSAWARAARSDWVFGARATTLYRLLAGQDPAGLEEAVFAQAKDLMARKVVRNDAFRVGVVSFDGRDT